jgi:hypothetical protein
MKREELDKKDGFKYCEVHRHALDIVSERVLREIPYTAPAHMPVEVQAGATPQNVPAPPELVQKNEAAA